jgi:glycosyltransferase involved in cell wall biosynthesis
MPLIIATILQEDGETGVHTHVRELRRYLAERDMAATLITPLTWNRLFGTLIFSVNAGLRRISRSASVAWYLRWHEIFLRNALRRRLAEVGECIVYAQSPTAARAALKARQGPHQRILMAVHFNESYANEFNISGYIRRNGLVYRRIRRAEQETIPCVNGIVYVSNAVRDALLSWLPEAACVRSAVISNFVSSSPPTVVSGACSDLVSIGALRPLKNHRFLLEVLAEAKRAGRIVTLDVFGDGSIRKELEQLTRSLGLEEQVHWRGFQPDVRSLLPGYKIYVHASHSEALPLALVEAMAAGLPIIAGKVGGIAEMGDSGLELRFWPLDDPAKAAVILTDVLDCEPARLKAASAAVARFRQDFDAHILGARLLSFLTSNGSATETRA